VKRLTWFKVDAGRFLLSNSFRAMDSAERGVYITLLLESWVQMNGCCLPASEKELARMLHVKKISPLVLQQFPKIITEEGEKRRNKVLFEEWENAKAASARKSENAKKGHEKLRNEVADAEQMQ